MDKKSPPSHAQLRQLKKGLLSEQFDDFYYSLHSGLAESQYIFLEGNHLAARWPQPGKFVICETGFGTGLNFLATWKLFQESAQEASFLEYISLEKYPVAKAQLAEILSCWEPLEEYAQKFLHQYPQNFAQTVLSEFRFPQVRLWVYWQDLLQTLPQLTNKVDAWFLDGFAPSKNPQMWSCELFDKMAELSQPGTTFATFTAAGMVKKGLRKAGFAVKRKPGFAGKRHMLVGNFEGKTVSNLTTSQQKPDLAKMGWLQKSVVLVPGNTVEVERFLEEFSRQSPFGPHSPFSIEVTKKQLNDQQLEMTLSWSYDPRLFATLREFLASLHQQFPQLVFFSQPVLKLVTVDGAHHKVESEEPKIARVEDGALDWRKVGDFYQASPWHVYVVAKNVLPDNLQEFVSWLKERSLVTEVELLSCDKVVIKFQLASKRNIRSFCEEVEFWWQAKLAEG